MLAKKESIRDAQELKLGQTAIFGLTGSVRCEMGASNVVRIRPPTAPRMSSAVLFLLGRGAAQQNVVHGAPVHPKGVADE